MQERSRYFGYLELRLKNMELREEQLSCTTHEWDSFVLCEKMDQHLKDYACGIYKGKFDEK